MCNSVTIEPNNKELECRRIIMQSIESALKRGDEVFEKLVAKDNNIPVSTFGQFKESLKNIDHENLKQ